MQDDLALLSYARSIEEEIAALTPESSTAPIERELERLGAIKAKAVKGKVRAEKAEPPCEYEIDGFRVLAGKNNLQNDELTFRTATGYDVWLHTKNRHGAHVIIITHGKKPSETAILTAAEIAASGAGAPVEVDYTERRFVKRRPGGHPGQVIYTDFRTVVAKPDSHSELRTLK